MPGTRGPIPGNSGLSSTARDLRIDADSFISKNPTSAQAEVLAAAWERGERLTAADILSHNPGLGTEAAIRLIYEEICLRREAGLEVKTEEFLNQFPRWRDELRDLIDCDRLLRAPGEVTRFPESGEDLGPFHLIRELGRGASGRTFLATEPTLADRPVVVKVLSSDQQEHLALAHLQHTHIIPLFSEHSFPEQGVRVLCMPYLGGANLAQILKSISKTKPEARSGKLLTELVDQLILSKPIPTTFESPFRRHLEQISFVKAIVWIAACLADALHYAHARGLVHMDIKPSNVLLTSDGQPLLLDFHLARGPIQPGACLSDRLGGTPGWMSPEQKAAMDDVTLAQPIKASVDGRTDIYSLGLMIREALSFSDETGRRLTFDDYPGVTVGLRDIVWKCLKADPSDRYNDAATLASDLRSHLYDLPLKGVGNRNLVEAWSKWRRRRPGTIARLIAWSALIVAASISLLVCAVLYRQRFSEIRNTLDDGIKFRQNRQYGEAIETLDRGIEAVASLPGAEDLTSDLKAERRRAQHGRIAADLNSFADSIRFRYGQTLPKREDRLSIIENCRTVWEKRAALLEPFESYLNSSLEHQVRTDLLEIAVAWVDVLIQHMPSESESAERKEATRVLDEAVTVFGNSLALELERQKLEASEGRNVFLNHTKPRSAWQHYVLGRYDLRANQIKSAAQEFRAALETTPEDFWSNFYDGRCAFELGNYQDALAAFRTCIALSPKSAPSYNNLAQCHQHLGLTDKALHGYSKAIELDPHLTEAMLNRGVLYFKTQHLAEAVTDFENGIQVGSTTEILGNLHYNLASCFTALGDPAKASGHLQEAKRLGFPNTQTLAEEPSRRPSIPTLKAKK